MVHNTIFIVLIIKLLKQESGVLTLILLGAGASKPFGLKTLQDLTEDLVEQMRRKGHGETIDIMLEALRKFGFTPDLEYLHYIGGFG